MDNFQSAWACCSFFYKSKTEAAPDAAAPVLDAVQYYKDHKDLGARGCAENLASDTKPFVTVERKTVPGVCVGNWFTIDQRRFALVHFSLASR